MTQYTLAVGALAGVATSALAFYNYYLLRKPPVGTMYMRTIVLSNMAILGISAFGLGVGSTLLMSKQISFAAILIVLYAGLNAGLSVANTVAIVSERPSLLKDLKQANLIIGASGAAGLLVLVLAIFAQHQSRVKTL